MYLSTGRCTHRYIIYTCEHMGHMGLKAAKVRGLWIWDLGLGIRVSGVGIRPIEGVTCANRYT